jgi:hypothetical protein
MVGIRCHDLDGLWTTAVRKNLFAPLSLDGTVEQTSVNARRGPFTKVVAFRIRNSFMLRNVYGPSAHPPVSATIARG